MERERERETQRNSGRHLLPLAVRSEAFFFELTGRSYILSVGDLTGEDVTAGPEVSERNERTVL